MGTGGGGEVRRRCVSGVITPPPHDLPMRPHLTPPSPSSGSTPRIPPPMPPSTHNTKNPVVPVLVLALVYLLQEVEVLDRVAHVPVEDDPGHLLFAHGVPGCCSRALGLARCCLRASLKPFSYFLWCSREYREALQVTGQSTMDVVPSQTIYINNLNEKVKVEPLKKAMYVASTPASPGV